MKLTLVKDKIVNESEHEWYQYCSKNKCLKLNSDKIYIKINPKCGKRNEVILNNIVYLGNDICNLVNLTENNLVDLFFDSKNPFYIKIKKTSSLMGYKISKSKGSCVLKFSFNCTPKQLSVCEPETIPVDFDLFEDRSILIDLTKFKAD